MLPVPGWVGTVGLMCQKTLMLQKIEGFQVQSMGSIDGGVGWGCRVVGKYSVGI